VIAKKTMMEEAIIIENLQSGDSNLQQETMQAIVDLMKLGRTSRWQVISAS
jgi:hypothetical protein